MKNYKKLSEDMRNLFINHAAQNPGFHLSSSLGLVETSIALLNVINNENVKILFDIGHQRYPFLVVEHYMRTGELKIPDKEIQHDIFLHPTFAGLSTALAAGAAVSTNNKVFALIGDGAFTSGEIYEGLNLLGELDANIAIVHNQNNMSIRENVGVFKDSDILKSFVNCFGFNFLEVSDGHNIKNLINAFRIALESKKKVFINIKTIKGKGYFPSENNPLEFHQPFMGFNVQSGEFYKPEGMILQFFECYVLFEKFLYNLLEKDNNVYLVFPSTPPFQSLIKQYPERVIDTGITEQLYL
ncbi:transketolase, thiamine diphosphate binding domain protein [Rickettsia argasii T170-B]|uniref:Transketolase, thiamine diphosphate binding domain protein n=1 Tax=Rickettsia argasii T170-B TaxID=1268837 RepID=A0A0F3RCV2_9RICK|nr:transketolase, thiamine diphosphate binding domain protein [Rickettsia argasii T170-B]